MDPLLLSVNGDLSLQGEAMKVLQNEMLMNIYSFFTDYYLDCFAIGIVIVIWVSWFLENKDEYHFCPDIIIDRLIIVCTAFVFFLKYLSWPKLNVFRTGLHIIIVLLSFTYTLGPVVLWLSRRISSIYNNRTGNKPQQYPKNEEQQKRIEENQAQRATFREGSAVQRGGSIEAEAAGSIEQEHRENQLLVQHNEAREEDHQFVVPSDMLRTSRSRSRSIRRSAQPDTPKRNSPGRMRKSSRESPVQQSPRRSQRIKTPTKQ